MSKQRKLQLEIDTTLKKIAEGVAEWSTLWDKLEGADEREHAKLTEALKRDLKRLQRLRECVRSWLAAGEVKEEAPLQEARRAVEAQMERFKVLEKEQKVKAFSAAGLQRDTADPVAVAKLRCADWLNDAVSRLEEQTEVLEADMEALGATGGRGKAGKASSAAAATLAKHISTHREHVARIERVLRLLENDQVTPDEVESALKESLEYYIEAFAEDGFMEDEAMWEALPLEAVDEGIGKISAHRAGGGGAKGDLGGAVEEEREREREEEGGGGGKKKGKAAKGEKAKPGGLEFPNTLSAFMEFY